MRGLADQALASGVNFLTLILVARAVTPSQFGYFALAFTLLQSAVALQLALVTRPHNVLGSRLAGDEYVRFTTTTVVYQLVFSLAAAALLAGGAGAARAAGAGSTLIFLVAAPTLVAWQIQELARRLLYTEGRLGGALANDVLSYGGQAALLVTLHQTGQLSGAKALVVIGATSALAAGVGAWQLRRSLGSNVDRRALHQTWRFGRWLGAAEIGYWFESQYYIYLAAALLGAVASAALKAGQTLLGPISVFLAFFVNYLPIRFSRDRARDDSASIAGQLRTGLRATVPTVAVYGVVIAVFARPALEAVYGEAYGRYAPLVRLFAVYYVMLSVSDVVVASLSAHDRTHRIFLGHLTGAVVSVALGWTLVEAFGATGGVGGMILALAAAFAVFVSGSIRLLPSRGRAPA